MSDESDKFYADLQDTINDVPANDMLVIRGDLSARVGKNQQKRKKPRNWKQCRTVHNRHTQ